MQPSKSSLDRLPKEIGNRWEGDREAFEAELRAVTEIPDDTKSIAVAIDGVLAPMKDGGAKETRARAAAAALIRSRAGQARRSSFGLRGSRPS